MRINKKYFQPDWNKFKKELLEHLPPGYKFKKNELKSRFRKVLGIYRANYKKNQGVKHGNE